MASHTYLPALAAAVPSLAKTVAIQCHAQTTLAGTRYLLSRHCTFLVCISKLQALFLNCIVFTTVPSLFLSSPGNNLLRSTYIECLQALSVIESAKSAIPLLLAGATGLPAPAAQFGNGDDSQWTFGAKPGSQTQGNPGATV